MYLDMDCRICGARRVELFLDLGDQPHCNRLIPKAKLGEQEPRYPLRVGFCHECTLVQIDHTIPKEAMFSDYLYVSGTTRTLVQHFQESAERLIGAYGLGPHDFVVDIGSNDGSWLQAYRSHGIRVLGVEAAKNVAQIAHERGVPTINRFFNLETARLIRAEHGPAKLITAAGVFFHLEELHSVVQGVRHLLADDGVLVVQAIYLGTMVDNIAFDQIYHEHLCYYTLRSLDRLFSLHGLESLEARLLPIHGGSLEVHAAKAGRRRHGESVTRFRAEEEAKGYGRFESYKCFAGRVWRLRGDLLAVLEEFRGQRKAVYAYGAPAKGATLLNSFGLDTRLVAKAVEKNPMKVGYWIPGVRVPIVAEGGDQPDAYLVLAWNFLEEFLEKEADYLRSGGVFIVPVPRVRVIGAGDLS